MSVKLQSFEARQEINRALWNDQLETKKLIGKSSLQKAGFENLKGATLKTGKTVDALINSKELFSNFFRSEVKAMTAGMNDNNVRAFTRVAEDKLSEIHDATFARMEDQAVSGQTISGRKKTMRAANEMAMEFLKELKPTAMDVATQDMRRELRNAPDRVAAPQMFKTEDGHFNLVRKAPQIENLVLKGGGAKGIGYPPALREMAETGMLDGLKQVVGTSAGALTAVAVSVGLTTEELQDFTNQDLMALMKGNDDLKALYPEADYKRMISFRGGDATPMLHALDRQTGEKVEGYLNTVSVQERDDFAQEYAARLNNGTTAEQISERISVLANPDFGAERTGSMVTFSDMAMLHAMAPNQFKNIQITAYDVTNQQPKTFNAAQSPDMPVAFAARASMAHPLIAKSIVLDDVQLADGGIASNVAAEAVYPNGRAGATNPTNGSLMDQEIRARTALMVFDDGNKAYTSLHGAPEDRAVKESLKGNIQSSLVNNPNHYADKAADRAKVYEGAGNTFVVFHGKIGTTDLKASDDAKQVAEATASMKMLEQISNRRDAAYMVEVDSPLQAYGLMTDEEKQLLVHEGEPQRENFANEDNFVAAGILYDLARQEWG